ncbi:hypothetical protein PENTCL1PPCAC_3585, partial [Pristionchus entomophagus]
DFGSEEGTANFGLKEFASKNYYFTDLSKNYMRNLEVLCEANCWCAPGFAAFNDDEMSPRTQANRGCYEMNFDQSDARARKHCSRVGSESMFVQGSLVSIHDQQKEFFVYSIASGYGYAAQYWIALTNNGTAWNWDDNSTSPFAEWADGQPDTKDGQLRCAYAARAIGFNVKWSAGDCREKHDFACETSPCSVEYLCVPCPGCSF